MAKKVGQGNEDWRETGKVPRMAARIGRSGSQDPRDSRRTDAGDSASVTDTVEVPSGLRHGLPSPLDAAHPSDERLWVEFAETFDGIVWMTTGDLQDSIYLSPGAYDVFERGPEEFSARGSWSEWVHPHDAEKVAAATRRLLGGARVDLEYRIVLPSGKVRWLHDRGFPIWDRLGRIVRLAGVAEDVTQRQVASRTRIKRREQLLAHVLDLVPHQIFAIDETGRFILANDATAKALGIEVNHLTGRHASDLIQGKERRQVFHEELLKVVREQVELREVEDRYVDATGTERVFKSSKVPLDLGGGAKRAMLAISEDITAEREAEEELRRRAFYDLLTSLPNRQLFVERLEHAMARCRRRDHRGFGVLFMDLDNFKEINDTRGHLAGDETLVEVSGRLGRCVRPGDTVSRFGGDEFAMLLEGAATADECRVVAQRVHDSLREPLELEGEKHFLSTSIGVALWSPDITSASEMLRDADSAMYVAKRRGPGHTQVFSSEIAAAVRHEVRLKNEIREQLRGTGFEMEFQPVVSLADGALAGMEALVRWTHQSKGRMLASEFVPVAERAGLIAEIDRWGARATFREMATWTMSGLLGEQRVGLNVSPHQLAEARFVPFLEMALREFDLDPKNLVIEVTESSLIRNSAATRNVLRSIRSMGALVALDDFGTGYSSLSHLHRFAIDIIKVDRSFVADIEMHPKRAAIVKATVQLALDLGLMVTAEGIETPQQRMFLAELGCHYGQGWLFDKSMDGAQMAKLLESGKAY